MLQYNSERSPNLVPGNSLRGMFEGLDLSCLDSRTSYMFFVLAFSFFPCYLTSKTISLPSQAMIILNLIKSLHYPREHLPLFLVLCLSTLVVRIFCGAPWGYSYVPSHRRSSNSFMSCYVPVEVDRRALLGWGFCKSD